MKNPTKQDVVDLILSMGHEKFFDSLKEITNDNVEMIDKKFPSAVKSRVAWTNVSMLIDKIKELFT